jgi:hypothetical protein
MIRPDPCTRSTIATRAAVLAMSLLIPALAAAQTGSISGTVTDAATGAPVANMNVIAYNIDLSGTLFGVDTDASGNYTISGITPGQYFVFTDNISGGGPPYVNEVFDNIPCPLGCDAPEVIDATFQTITAGAVIQNINFALEVGGSVSGTVTDVTGKALPNVGVAAIRRFGNSLVTLGADSTDASGAYTITGLPPGPVYLLTTAQGLVNEIYDNIPCMGSCNTTTATTIGTAVTVTSGATTSGHDFALDPGGTISGTITNAAGAALQNVSVQAFTRIGGANFFVSSAQTNASGVYTLRGLPTGNYFVFTNGGGVVNELYDNILCPLTCNSIMASGVEVPVKLNEPTSGRDFALETGGSIAGVVTSQATGNPLQFVQVTVVTRAGTALPTRSAQTNAAGQYIIRGLPAGTYWLYTSFAPGGYVNEIHDNIPCLGQCSQSSVTTIGAAISVGHDEAISGKNFALEVGGGVSGTVRSAASGNPISDDLQVQLYVQAGTSRMLVGQTSPNDSGVFTFSGLAAGTYYLATTGMFHGHRNEMYDNMPCYGSTCNSVLASATPIPVALGSVAAGKDFALDRADILFGKVTSSATGQPLTGASVSLYQRGSGAFVGTATVDYRGGFIFTNLTNGTYVAFTSNSMGYQNEIYDGITCATTCSSATALASGTPIEVTGAAALAPQFVSGINFALDVRNLAPGAPTNFRASVSGFTAQFSWTPPTPSTTGVPVSYVIDAGVAPGTTIVSLPAGTGTSFTVPGVPSGTFYVRVRAVNASGSGPASNEVKLVIAGAGVSLPDAPTSPFASLTGTGGGFLTLTWTPAVTGATPTGYLVEAGTATGLANIATLPVTGRSFSFTGVPRGFYFLRVRARNAGGVSPPSVEVMIVVGGVPSPTGPPSFTSHSVNGNTVRLNWAAPTFGTATSYFIEAGSATGLANLATVNTGNTNTTISFSGVPAGTYYVRLRGVNAQGMSIVSNERTITVQ